MQKLKAQKTWQKKSMLKFEMRYNQRKLQKFDSFR